MDIHTLDSQILGHLDTYICLHLGLIIDAVEFWINLDLSDTAFEHFIWGYLYIWIYLHRLIESLDSFGA